MPISGAWRVSFSLRSFVDSREGNYAYITVNGEQVTESFHSTYSDSGKVGSTGGREVTLEVSAGDSITLETTTMEGSFYDVLTCFNFIPTM